jgi:antitoxin MazE
MQTTIQKWGNSLALRIPKAFAQQSRLTQGSAVSLALENGSVVMKPLKRRKLSLAGLVAKMTPRNCHEEVAWGQPRGKENW